MIKLSTGQDSTLGNYRKLTAVFFGEDSKATQFIDEKISRSLIGKDEEVIVDEAQMIQLLAALKGEHMPDEKAKRATEFVPYVTDDTGLLGGLLAVIHRDGGQHLQRAGVQKSVEAAIRIIVEMRAALEQVNADYIADNGPTLCDCQPEAYNQPQFCTICQVRRALSSER
jgi:hypothetical protein